MSAQVTTQRRESPGKKAKLLFVDDEPRILNSMRALFRRDYAVFIANGGPDALKIIDREAIDVVVSDQRMPEMSGVEVLSAVKERSPRTMRILLTGYADLKAIEASINESEVFRYLMKPCPTDELRNTIAMAVDATLSSGQRTGGTAELIPFPASTSRKEIPRLKPVPVPVSERRPAKGGRSGQAAVDVLVLTTDAELLDAIRESNKDARQLHHSTSIEMTVEILAEYPIGVLITDTAVDEAGIDSLMQTLKLEVPELVTIIASDRADAHSLIELINHGQIFRFLLKPVRPGQCRLWIDSAARKFGELTASDRQCARSTEPQLQLQPQKRMLPGAGFLKSIGAVVARIRARVQGD